MLEKLEMGFGIGFEWFCIGFTVILSISLLLELIIGMKKIWQEGDNRFKQMTRGKKVVITFLSLILFVMMNYLGFVVINSSSRAIERRNDIKQNPTNVAKYYKMEQKGEFLYLNLKYEYSSSWLLQNHVKAKIAKEEPKSYQIEYQGDQFEIEKEKK